MPSTRHPVSLPSLVRGHAQVDVDARTLLRHEPAWRRDLLVRLTVGGTGILLLQPVLIVAGFLLLIPWVVRYLRVESLMKNGETVPAKLISVSPPMVAAYGDLSRGLAGSYPVLVIFEVPEDAFSKQLQRGDRVPVVARGVGGDLEKFSCLEFRLIPTVTDDEAIHQAALDSIPEWDWESLDEAVFDLPNQAEPGVHELRCDPDSL